MKTCLFSIFLFITSLSLGQKDVGGLWHSSFVVMGQPMLLDLEIDSKTNEAAIIAPDQSMFKMICSEVILDDNLVHFAWKQGGLEYQGFYHPEGDSIYGTMKQNGIEWEVTFLREIQQKKALHRPQTPTGPTNYTEKEVSYVNPVDQVTIHGTLTLPINPKNEHYPIVVFASGSGPQDRNCTILGHQSFYVIADYLAKQGIGSLRFDDRGTGKSTASYNKASLEDFGNDVISSVNYLKKNKQLKKHPIGLLGHSEGGMHILLAQEKLKKKISFLIFLASIGGTGEQTLVQQQYDIPIKNGSSVEAATWNAQVYRGMSEIILRVREEKACNDSLQKFLSKMYYAAPKGSIEGQTESGFIFGNQQFLNNPWGRQFLAFNAANYLKKIQNIPVLALFGGSDIQVEPTRNSYLFQEALAENHTAKKVIEIVPGLNHLLQKCSSCNVLEYGELSETMNPLVLEKIAQFIVNL